MKKDRFVFSNGSFKRKDNTLFYCNSEGKKTVVPIETVRSIYLFGETDLNTKLLNFLAQKNVQLHIFNYYGFYAGSFIPRESLLSGEVIVRQVKKFTKPFWQLLLAKELIAATRDNMCKNLAYYANRGKSKLEEIKTNIEAYSLDKAKDIEQLMGIEGNIRKSYYQSFNTIIDQEIDFEKRVKHPPDNMINTLISFGNSMLYTAVLSEIYRTQLNPTISFYHKPSYRRYSLALDISELFKPILVDRIIFKLLNKNMISEKDFKKELNFCYMKEKSRSDFVKAFDEKLSKTIRHKKLGRNVSYRHLIRLECYKFVKVVLENIDYEAFRIWW